MRNISLQRELAATSEQIWAVLADFANIADWNDGIKKSFSTSAATEGTGAQRHCDLAPMGALEETIREWVPAERMVVSIDSASRIPIKRGQMTFTLGEGTATTPFTMGYDYEPKGGPLKALIGSMMDGKLRKGFSGFLDQLESTAQQRSAL